jgi:hypothetical protein
MPSQMSMVVEAGRVVKKGTRQLKQEPFSSTFLLDNARLVQPARLDQFGVTAKRWPPLGQVKGLAQ